MLVSRRWFGTRCLDGCAPDRRTGPVWVDHSKEELSGESGVTAHLSRQVLQRFVLCFLAEFQL